jgi:hypothetical protein
MDSCEKTRFDALYTQHSRALKLQCKKNGADLFSIPNNKSSLFFFLYMRFIPPRLQVFSLTDLRMRLQFHDLWATLYSVP